MQYRRTLATLTLAAGLVLTGCANNDDADTSEAHNDADVEFAQQMIPHHEQAVEMAQLAETRADSPEVKDLAADIEAAQDPEIQTMTGWLQSWGEDVPEESMSGMDADDMSADDMSGMMSEEEMSGLEGASGAGFDRRFLTMMIEHHEQAVEMAKTEQADGEYQPAIELAEDIESAQTAEVATMRELLGS